MAVPCGWVPVWCGDTESPAESPGDSAPTCSHLLNLSDAMQEVVINSAIEFLWEATNRRLGLCTVTIRPCGGDCESYQSTYRGYSGIPYTGYGYWGSSSPWIPINWNGQWFNLPGCGGCGNNCDSSHMDRIQIPGPVGEILEVFLDGATFTDWTFDNLGLARTDGQMWPRTQNQSIALDQPDTFGVMYTKGVPVPAAGQLAAGILACEFARAACDDGTCRLPKSIQTITREGVTAVLQDNFLALDGKRGPRTGIWVVDSFLASQEYSARNRVRVLSPNARSKRRV